MSCAQTSRLMSPYSCVGCSSSWLAGWLATTVGVSKGVGESCFVEDLQVCWL